MAYRSLSKEQQARFDPMITGFNPGGHVRRGPHPPGAQDLSRRLHRDRRVHHSQGVRVVQGRGRGRQPDRSGPGPDPRLRRRGGPGRAAAQRHGHAVRQSGDRAGLPDPDEGAAAAAPQDDDHLGPHRAGPHRAPGAGLRLGPATRAEPQPRRHRRGDPLRPEAPPRLLRHQLGRGGEVPPGHPRDHPPLGRP